MGVVVILLLFATWQSRRTEVRIEPRLEILEQARAVPVPSENIDFCFRLDGREDMHLPDLLGYGGDDIHPNNIGGFNWSLPPQSSGSEPYGILSDGTGTIIFLKKYFLERWDPFLVEIKADIATAETKPWEVIETDQGKINGEEAYFHKFRKYYK